MKKFVVLSLFGSLILAFGSIVYGQEKAPVLEFKASGWIDVLTEWKRNVPDTDGGGTTNAVFYGMVGSPYTAGGAAFDRYEAYLRSRGRLRFDAIMGKEMMGTFNFEIDSTRWGEVSPRVTGRDSSASKYYINSTSAAAQRNYAGTWDTDRAALEVKHMYMTFGMPWVPVPITVQAGLMPIGVRPSFNFSNDGAGIVAAIKMDPALIKLMWFKQIENQSWAADDDDIYGVDINAKVQDLTIGGYLLYFKMNTYPFTGAYTPFVASSSTQAANSTPSSIVDYKGTMWWPGLYVDGKLGPVNLTWDLGISAGKIEDHQNVAPASRYKDAKYSGWATRLDVSYPWEKFTFGFVGVYGPGVNAEKTPASGMPYSTTRSAKIGAYANTPGNNNGPGDLFIINGHGDFLRGATGYISIADGAMSESLYAGLWYAQLYGKAQLSDQDKFTLRASYVGDTNKNCNRIGNAREADGVTLRDDKTIGFEFDLLNSLMIYKNLTWDVGLGIVVPGKAMESWNDTTKENEKPKTPWELGTRLVYSF